MFLVAYLPQLAVLVFVNGPLAAFTTILLTLSESSTLINLLSRTFLLQDALVDTFDGVLVSRRQTGVLSEGRQLKSGNFNDPMEKLGKLIKSPFEKFTPKAFIRYIMYLPLNFIPVVGTVIFVALQGRSRGNSVHTRVSRPLPLKQTVTDKSVVLPAEEVVEPPKGGLAEGEHSSIHCVSSFCPTPIFLIMQYTGNVNTVPRAGAVRLCLDGQISP